MRNTRIGKSFTESQLTYYSQPTKAKPRYVIQYVKPVVICLILVILWSYL